MTQESASRAEIHSSSQEHIVEALTRLIAEEPAFDELVTHIQLPKGRTVATARELTNNLYVIMSGQVKLVCTNQKKEARRFVVATLASGAIFGDGILSIPGAPRLVAEAETAISVWQIPASCARDMATKYPILGLGLLQTYSERLLQIEDNLESVAYKKLPMRLAGLLLELGNYENGIITGVIHQTLADYLGTYRETVSALLREFKQRGLVMLGYRRIALLDVALLKEEAGIYEW